MIDRYLTSVCGSNLWNVRSVYLPYPDFTFCFQYTLLLWIPCFVIWCGMPLWIFMITKSTGHKIKISWLLSAKTVSILGLILIESYNLFRQETHFVVYYLSPLILIITFVIVLLITHYERIQGWRNSSFTFIFWLILVLSLTFTSRTKLNYIFNKDKPDAEFGFKLTEENEILFKLNSFEIKLFFIEYGLVVISLILFMCSEKLTKSDKEGKSSEPPEIACSLAARLTFWWSNSLISVGFKRDLTREDLWDIDTKLKSYNATSKIEKEWNKRAAWYVKAVNDQDEKRKEASILNRNEPGAKDEEMHQLNTKIEDSSRSKKNKNKQKVKSPSLGICLVKLVLGKFIGVLALKICHDSLNFVSPVLLDKLIMFINDKQQSLTLGFFLIFILCLSSMTQTLINQHYYFIMFKVGSTLKISLMNLIYKKSLRLSASARKDTTLGEMTNLITTNALTFSHCSYNFIGIISAPFQIAIASYLLYQKIGIATFIGMTTMIVFIPLNAYFAGIGKKLRTKKYQQQDTRIKMTNEILNGIRMIRFYGWEKSFQSLVNGLRKVEIRTLIKSALLSTVTALTWAFVPFIVACTSFAVYLLMDKSNNLDPSKAFVSLTLFNMLRMPLNQLPHIIQGLIQLNVSLSRIRNFLLRDEINQDNITHYEQGNLAINIEKISFGWSKQDPVLHNVNLKIQKGQLYGIVGSVGSGKSSLLSSILGDTHKINPSGLLNVNGSLAYVPQQAWIQNNTVQENILFSRTMDKIRYESVLKASALITDLNLMPAYDLTEIGEKGINLSGGQKQRVSLARAAYSDADIYLLDDPLSAVDVHVGKSIFDEMLGTNGILKNKTRVFVTNSLNFLPHFDRILMVEEGKVVQEGTYEELTRKPGSFNEFIKLFSTVNQFSSEKNKDSDVEESSSKKKLIHEEILEKKSGIKTKSCGGIVVSEKVESGKVKPSVILEYLRACGLWLTLIFLLVRVFSYVSSVLANFWLSDWSNEAAASTDTDSAVEAKFNRLIIYALLCFTDHFITFLTNACFVGMLIRATTVLHDKLLFGVLRSRLRFFESTPTGRIINRFTKDIEATENDIPYSIKSLVDCSMSFISMIVIISTSTPWFLVVLVPITAAYIAVQRYFVPSNRQIKRLRSVTKSPVFSHFSETQAGVTTIRAYKLEQIFIERMQAYIDNNLTCAHAESVANRWLSLRLGLFGNVITIFASVFAILARDTLSAGLAGLSISTSLSICGTLNWFVQATSSFEVNITSVERIREYIDLTPEAEWSIEESKPDKNWPYKGEIVLKGYSVKYRADMDNVVNDINLSIYPGEKIGIVGRTGSGKSSLTLGLFRMLELVKGSIFIDGIDTAKIGLHDLRHKLTIIPQDPTIFSGTIKMNLDPFNVYSDRDLWVALEISHLKEFVTSLENGLMFECSEGGGNLSLGQRQLLCLARALLRKSKVLILDEATASVDHNTDDLIQKTIRREFSDSTVLNIAHRLNTVMDSSRILVLDGGRIAEFDTPEELLKNTNGVFYSMARQAQLI